MNKQFTRYKKGFLVSIGIHFVLLLLLLFTIERPVPMKPVSSSKKEIVEAVILDEKQVAQEFTRLEKIEEQKKAETLKNETALAEIKLAKEQEKKQLEMLKREQEKEKKQLAALEEKRREAQEKAKQQRIEQEKEEKKQAALQKKKLEEAKKLAQEAESLEENPKEVDSSFLTTEIEKYDALMKQKINQSWSRPPGLPGGLSCELYARLLPDGSVISPTIKTSSGNPAFDQAAIAALQKASPLPVPSNSNLMDEFRQFNFKFSPPEET